MTSILSLWSESLMSHGPEIAVIFATNLITEGFGGCHADEEQFLDDLTNPLYPVKESLLCATADVANFDTWTGTTFTNAYFSK